MKRITTWITLTVKGPVLTKASAMGRFGVDALMASSQFANPVTGAVEPRYYLPGRLIKGLLREALQELSTLRGSYAGLIREWLGEEPPEGTGDDPLRGRLLFGDFADLETPVGEEKLRYRIQIDECRGAADAQKLQVMESPYAAGKPVKFTGKVRFLISDEESAQGRRGEVGEALERGLRWVRSVGGNRTVGFGEIQDVSVGKVLEEAPPAEATAQGTVWNLRLNFQEPLMFSERRIAENLFESGDIIPGGALKGALAEMIKVEPAAFGALTNELHKAGITHAFPAVKGGSRPEQWPLSLLAFDEVVIDAIRRDGWFLRGGKAGAFDIDWKEPVKKQVRERFRWPKLERELRVRVSIDSALGKAADQDLFAWRMALPHKTDWFGRVDASELSTAAREQLERLLRFGVEPIGKTKALATTEIREAPQPAPQPVGSFVVTLQTPALLIDPSRRLAPAGNIGSGRHEDLRLELIDAWSDLSGGSLTLVSYFQRCTLAGGKYFQQRFLGTKRPYRPYLLSNAGSTFLLKPANGRDDDARECLRRWERKGLPLSAGVRAFYAIPDAWDQQWRHCPYLPENGYGEIAVNQAGPYPEA